MPEFAAWARGAPLLAARDGLELPPHYLLVSLGTGTSVLSLDRGRATRVGGSALGGGTLLGLGRLLLGVETLRRDLRARGARRPAHASTCWSATSTRAARSRCRST